MASFRFSKDERIRTQRDFAHIKNHGQRIFTEAFILVFSPAQAGITQSRLGVIASKRTIGNAVKRVRAKRRLRELFRLNKDIVSTPHDILLIARKAVLSKAFPNLQADFENACKRLSSHTY